MFLSYSRFTHGKEGETIEDGELRTIVLKTRKIVFEIRPIAHCPLQIYESVYTISFSSLFPRGSTEKLIAAFP